LGVDNLGLIGANTGCGTGERWSLPAHSFETIVRPRDGRLLVGNDNNYQATAPGTRAPRTTPS
jgi:glycerophosphoryl diester phosphodiesterase